MADPIIRSLEPSKPKIVPGEAFSIRMDAYDPDSKVLRFEGIATDQDGNTAKATTVITVEDGLTGSCVEVDNAVTLVQDPTDPFLWHGRAPNG